MAPRKQTKSPGGTSVPKKKVAANGFKLPDHIPFGTVVTDIAKKSWIIGPSIGQGGFGEIYLASNNVSRPVPPTAEYVVKIEPHTNGPLFTEMHCYMRIGRPSLIDDWMTSHKLHKLGMPQYLGSGSFDHVTGNKSCVKYRFMVMERFGSDLQKILDKHNKKFSFKTAYQVGLDIIDALEYIHAQGYIHADIKASNLLIGYKKGTENQVFLVDYGLACRYSVAGVHKEYKYDGRRAHDGTIEFTSRDAHIGAHSRRGDLEILGYNLLQWLAGSLPWEDCLTDCDAVAKMKRHYMDNIPALLDKCFPDYAPQPPGLAEYLVYVSTLTFDEEPDYSRCRSILRAGLIARGHQDDNKLVFAPATPAAKIPGKVSRRGKNSSSTPAETAPSASSGKAMAEKNPRASAKTKPVKLLKDKTGSVGKVPKMKALKSVESNEASVVADEASSPYEEAVLAASAAGFDNPTPAILDIFMKKNAKLASLAALKNKSKKVKDNVDNDNDSDKKTGKNSTAGVKSRQRKVEARESSEEEECISDASDVNDSRKRALSLDSDPNDESDSNSNVVKKFKKTVLEFVATCSDDDSIIPGKENLSGRKTKTRSIANKPINKSPIVKAKTKNLSLSPVEVKRKLRGIGTLVAAQNGSSRGTMPSEGKSPRAARGTTPSGGKSPQLSLSPRTGARISAAEAGFPNPTPAMLELFVKKNAKAAAPKSKK